MDNIIFQRAKPSDMLEGILDTMELLELELQKINRFWPEISSSLYSASSFISNLQNLRNNSYQARQLVHEWRLKGM